MVSTCRAHKPATSSDLHTAVVIFPVPLRGTNPCVLNFEFKFTVKDLAGGGGSLINLFCANQISERIYGKGHPDFF